MNSQGLPPGKIGVNPASTTGHASSAQRVLALLWWLKSWQQMDRALGDEAVDWCRWEGRAGAGGALMGDGKCGCSSRKGVSEGQSG